MAFSVCALFRPAARWCGDIMRHLSVIHLADCLIFASLNFSPSFCVDYNDPQALPPIVKEYVPPERGPKPVPEFVVKAVAHPTAEPVGHCRMLYGSVMCVTIHLLYSLVRLSFRFCACLWNEWIRYVWSDCLTGSFQLRPRMPMLKTQCVGFLFWLYYSMWTG